MCYFNEKDINDVENVFYDDREEAREIYEEIQGAADADWEEYEHNVERDDELADDDEYPPENL